MKYNISFTKVQHSNIGIVDFNNIPFGRIFSDHMFIADYENGEWINPRIEPVSDINMHPSNLTLHYGQAIFEGMKAFKTKKGEANIFRLKDHAKRFNESAHRMCMPDFPEDLFCEALSKLVGIDAQWIPPVLGSALYVRPFMFATSEFLGVMPSEKYRFMVIACPVGPYYAKPVSLLAETHFVRAVNGGVGEAKCAGNYAASLLPAKLAKEKGFDQVMWMDAFEFKYVQESGTMNIFFIVDGKALTPSADGSILKGITRDSLLTILKDKGIEVEARPISIDELIEAYKKGTFTEAFGTGTAAVVAKVCKIRYKDFDMEFSEENMKIGSMLKETIELIRNGDVEDKHNWLAPAFVEETIEA